MALAQTEMTVLPTTVGEQVVQVIDTEEKANPVLMQAPVPEQIEGTHQAEGKEPPSALCKCCCPPCAVYQHEGCTANVVAAFCLGWCFTMICWNPQ